MFSNNHFQVIGKIIGKPTVSLSGDSQYQFTNVLVEVTRPGRNNTVIAERIPLQIFGDHIESRGLAVGVWVIVTGRLGVANTQSGSYPRVSPMEIQAIGDTYPQPQDERPPYSPAEPRSSSAPARQSGPSRSHQGQPNGHGGQANTPPSSPTQSPPPEPIREDDIPF